VQDIGISPNFGNFGEILGKSGIFPKNLGKSGNFGGKSGKIPNFSLGPGYSRAGSNFHLTCPCPGMTRIAVRQPQNLPDLNLN
jgi:hypothetical protein